MKRLAVWTIETDGDGEAMCSERCPGRVETDDGDPLCGIVNRELTPHPDYDDRFLRERACIEATAQADRLVAVRDARKGVVVRHGLAQARRSPLR